MCATDWEKILANHISDEGLVSRMYKELSKVTKGRKEGRKKERKKERKEGREEERKGERKKGREKERKKSLQLENGQKHNTHFTKVDIEMANNHTKRCSIALVISKLEIKTTMRYHFILIRMANIKIVTSPNAGKDVEKLDQWTTHILLVGM